MKMNLPLILKRKLNYLIHFWLKKYSLISNDSKLPSRLHYKKRLKHLSIIKFSRNDIFDINQQLDSH